MNSVISETNPIARKAYECNACYYVRMLASGDVDFSIADLRKIVLARRDGWKILPGQRYNKQVQKFEGELVVVRSRPEIMEICHRHKLYGDDW